MYKKLNLNTTLSFTGYYIHDSLSVMGQHLHLKDDMDQSHTVRPHSTQS